MEYFTVLCVALSVLGTTAIEPDHYEFSGEVFEVAVDNQSQSVYVGGMNIVYRLTTNLTLLGSTTLADCDQADACDNRVTVLEVDSALQRLLVCGTHGQCWMLGLRDLDKQLLSSLQGDFLSRNVQRPQVKYVGHQDTGNGEHSKWMVASPNNEKNRPILSVKEILKSEGAGFEWKYSQNGQERSAISKHNASFLFDLVDGLCFGEECFYLTLQQVNSSSHWLINRLASVCATSLFPYVEKQITVKAEQSDYSAYNRTVGFTLGKIGDKENNVFVIMVFGKPVSLFDETIDYTKGFVLGAIQLSRVKRFVTNTRLMCSKAEVYLKDKIQTPDWYTGQFTPCHQHLFQEERCPSSLEGNWVIQSKADLFRVRSTADVKGNDGIGRVTSVFTHTEPMANGSNGQIRLDDHMTIYVVTSTGRIFKFHAQASATVGLLDVHPLDSQLTEGDLRLPAGLRSDVALSEQHFYLLSGTKLIRKLLDPCVDITDCRDCISVKGCGWCSQLSQCRLLAKCEQDRCPPEVRMVFR